MLTRVHPSDPGNHRRPAGHPSRADPEVHRHPRVRHRPSGRADRAGVGRFLRKKENMEMM